jgi:tricorn protease
MRTAVLLGSLWLGLSAPRAAADPDETLLLSQPAVSATHVAFAYADDLWVADRDGKNPRRLTSDVGAETNPVFSPDGKLIAFSGQYEGNIDVYVVSVEGGSPRRLTWHPGPDTVRCFTPDGKAVVFSSPRESFNSRYTQLYAVPVAGGFPTKLPVPNGVQASISPDGKRIAYTPLSDVARQWKNYRGGTHSRVWLLNLADSSVEQVPQPETRCNDTDPQWLGDAVYFRSDRYGEYNVFAYDCAGRRVRQLTHHADFPVVTLSSGGGQVVYEQAGRLHRLDPSSGEAVPLKIRLAADLVETRPRYVKGAKHIRSAAVSPSGARAAFDFRGEIVTLPAEKGDPRNLTQTPGVHEREPAWSPDGKSVAYFSDAGGVNKLHVRAQDGSGEARVYPLNGAGFYERPLWSPDGKKLAYSDNSQSLFWIDLDSGKSMKVAQEPLYGPVKWMRYGWSPDSKWLAYTVGNKSAIHTAHLYSLADGKSRPVTDGLSDIGDVAFDAGGKYLYLLGSTEAGPVKQWFAQSGTDLRAQYALYVAVLDAKTLSPFAKESDEEKAEPEKPKAETKPVGVTVAIEFDGLGQRIVAAPGAIGNISDLEPAGPNAVCYMEAQPNAARGQGPPPVCKLQRYDITKRKAETLREGIDTYRLTPDGKKVLTHTPPETWAIADAAPGVAAGKGKLNTEGVEVRIDPRAEWPEIFDEAWRINRDYFYDPHYHGADWNAVRAKYAAFLPHLATREDLNRVMQWMASELAVGHSRVGGGDRLYEPKKVPGGLLGADFEVESGRYRFKKVYGGLNLNPTLRAPLTQPGVGVKRGDYLLAVNGRDLRPPTSVYAPFENTAGKTVSITVGPSPDGQDARTVTVEPNETDLALRYLDWVEGNIQKVHKATDGRVAYVYVPNTATLGYTFFKRYFFPQAGKEAIIIDERFNAGGQVADYYIDILRRPFTAFWATRHGEDITTPGAAVFGPKVMIIDETAGSGGDLLPWMFRKYRLGTLVGKRTWGGLVGTLGFPVLMDGGGITAPDLAFWTPEEGFGVENVGVPPDVEVEQWPAEVLAGHDPQLERAIRIVMEELKKNPPRTPQRPPYPVRVK